ncbi:MAG: ATP-dependent helicase [Gemmatimonadota bacterium]
MAANPDPPSPPPSPLPRVYNRESAVPARAAPQHSEINAEQAAAAGFGDGPLLVIAGAGTGKTRTLIHRVAALIDRGVQPERICVLTFTRRAAQEMLGRCEKLVGSASRRVHGGTFHATGHRLLRRFGGAAGVPADFTIMDQSDAEDLMQVARAHAGPSADARPRQRFPKKESLLYIYSRLVNTGEPTGDILRTSFQTFVELQPSIEAVFGAYTGLKARRNLVDYDDLLLFWLALLESGGSLGSRIAGLYDHILVDEYQDTNVLQAHILQAMCRDHRNITVVGDDAQSIYSFRGASFRNILGFPATFPGTTIIALEQNYRSTQPILDVTNTVIARAEERFTKNLWTAREGGERPWLVSAADEQQQTRFVVERILELYEEGTPLGEIAVLFRAGYMSADLEIELTNRKLPYEKWGGLRFLEAAHVKDVLAFLRVVENPRDEVSWYRILLLLPGIGEATARQMIAEMSRDAWDAASIERVTPPPRAREAHRSLAVLLKRLGRGEPDAVPVGVDIARIRGLYDNILRERYDRVEPRLSDLDQLQSIATGYPSRTAFLAAIALEPPQSTQDLASGSDDDEGDALILSTAHSAKGKEWDAVFLIWAVDGWFPLSRATADDDELEEERRLMYVALTRARNHLAVVCPMNSYATRRGADYSIDQVSRFIDRGVRELMEAVVPRVVEEDKSSAAPSATGFDLRAAMRERFGGG